MVSAGITHQPLTNIISLQLNQVIGVESGRI